MTDLILYFFLAIVQVDGGVGMTFSTIDECIETRAKAATDAKTLFLSDCLELKLTPITIPKDNRT
jgi:hypothetical protein